MLDFYVKRRTRFSLRDKRLLEIIEVEITTVDCSYCEDGYNMVGSPLLGTMPNPLAKAYVLSPHIGGQH